MVAKKYCQVQLFSTPLWARATPSYIEFTFSMLGYPPRFYLSSFVLDTLALNPGSLIVPQERFQENIQINNFGLVSPIKPYRGPVHL